MSPDKRVLNGEESVAMLNRAVEYNEALGVYELWKEINEALSDERERHGAYLLFNCNLKPRQIVQLYPQEFGAVQELYKVRKKVFDHFTKNADILRWLLQE